VSPANRPLTRPFASLGEWTAFLRSAAIPVYRATITAIESARQDEEKVSPAMLAEIVQEDALMTLKVLAYVSQRRPARVVTESATVRSALVQMGVAPFFRAFEQLECVEDMLGENPRLLDGLVEVDTRAYRAANFALYIAVERGDRDAEVIQEASLLHEFAEMLLWCHAPALALRLREVHRANPAMRTEAAQRAVLNVSLAELQHALMREWRLPELLTEITDHDRAHLPQVRNVLLAVNLARHSEHGWDDPALPDDFRAIGSLLNVSGEFVESRIVALET
jgi:HD-like signal output (HDOD) protein